MAGHAYGVKDAIKEGDVCLLLLRNPWGSYVNTGPWGEKSSLWDQHPKLKSKWEQAYGKGDHGTFWMSYEDFLQVFVLIDVCNKKPSIDDAGHTRLLKTKPLLHFILSRI